MTTPLTNGRIVKTDTRISTYLEMKELGGLQVLSRTDGLAVLECPSKFKKGAVEPDERSWERNFGSLVDCKITQPGKLAEYFVAHPAECTNSDGEVKPWDFRGKRSAWRTEREAKGLIVCSGEDFDEADAAVECLMTHPKHGEQTQRLIAQSAKQVFVIAEYHDQKTGIKVAVKVLHDILPDVDSEFNDSIFDIKTIASAVPHKWREAVFNFNWHVQAALGLDVYNATNPVSKRKIFRHIIIENSPPYECAFRWMDAEFIEQGRNLYLCGLQKYCDCVKSGEWPGYRDEGATEDKHGYESCSPTSKMVEWTPLPRAEEPAWVTEKISTTAFRP